MGRLLGKRERGVLSASPIIDDPDSGSTNENGGGSPDDKDLNTPDPVGPTPCGPQGCPPGYNCVDGECVDETGSKPEPKKLKADGQTPLNKQLIDPLKSVDNKIWYGVGIGFALMLLIKN